MDKPHGPVFQTVPGKTMRKDFLPAHVLQLLCSYRDKVLRVKLQDGKQANVIKDLAKTSQVEHIKGYLSFLFLKSCFFCLTFLTVAELPKIGGKGDDWIIQLTANPFIVSVRFSPNYHFFFPSKNFANNSIF